MKSLVKAHNKKWIKRIKLHYRERIERVVDWNVHDVDGKTLNFIDKPLLQIF